MNRDKIADATAAPGRSVGPCSSSESCCSACSWEPRRSSCSASRGHGINWTTALVAGLLGSFVGGLLVSLLAGDGLALRPSGIIGSIVGAILVTLAWDYWQGRQEKVA